ncbi:MAG TPA: roadblock/LC7 domain-containing protein [Vicinamibacteria bacterium]
MPYLRQLERLLRTITGSQAALLLDAQGEVVVEAGARDDRHRLIAAYQGIGLAMAQRATARFATGHIGYMVCRYARGSVLLRPLKDGYYLVVSLAAGAGLAQAVRHSAATREDLDREL